jgi:outer membrane receptor protein involved in Fe transport
MKCLISVLKSLFLFLLILGISAVTIHAQEEQNLTDLSLDDLLNIPISVSSTNAKTIFNTPSSVSVIDENMIKKFNYSSVAEALNNIPGLQINRTYLKRNIPTSRGILQDHYANKVLVLINGVATWNTVTGEASIDKINIHDVERIEVLKGPASVLYGTNAYSGAINIVLKNPGKESARSYIGVGSEGFFEAGANYSYSSEDFKLFISGNSSDEAGQDYTFFDEKKVKGHYYEYMKGSNFNLNASYKGHSVLFNTFVAHESYLGVEPLWTSGTGNNEWSNGYLFAYNLNHRFSELFGIKYGFTYDWNQRNLSRTLDDNTRANLKGYRVYNNVILDFAISENLNIEGGFDYDIRKGLEYKNYNVQKDSLLAANYMENIKVNEYSFFAQAGYTLNSINFLVGTRYSNNELFGNNLSSRASVVYSFNEKNSVKLIWGQSYRAPSLFELYFRTPTNTVFGNTALNPEKSNSVELSYLTSFDKFFIQALVYHANYQNKIFRTRRVPASLTDKSTIYVNGSTFKADGLELEIKYQNEEFADVFANYSYTKGDNGDEVANNGVYNFKFVPKHVISSGISKRVSSIFMSLVLNYISETDGFKSEISGFVIANVNVGYEHKLGQITLRHNLGAKNIFDENVLFPEFVRGTLNEIPSGYGRRIFYEVQLQM